MAWKVPCTSSGSYIQTMKYLKCHFDKKENRDNEVITLKLFVINLGEWYLQLNYRNRFYHECCQQKVWCRYWLYSIPCKGWICSKLIYFHILFWKTCQIASDTNHVHMLLCLNFYGCRRLYRQNVNVHTRLYKDIELIMLVEVIGALFQRWFMLLL